MVLGAIALVWFLSRNKNTVREETTHSTPVDSSSTAIPDHTALNSANSGNPDWSSIDFNVPAVQYDEVTDKNIETRGDNNFGIYGLGENVLFDEGKATVRSDAAANLKQVATSIIKRYNGGEVRIYGYTDAQGSAGANKELAQQRADAVRNWLQNNGIDANRISVNAIGENKPVASNNTERGRQQNRRVEIVARTK